MKREPTGRVLYDLNPFGELQLFEGPPGYDVQDLDPANLPLGFRPVTREEWERLSADVEVVEWSPCCGHRAS